MAKKAKAEKRCPECGGPGPYGAASGLCFECSDKACDELLKELGIEPEPFCSACQQHKPCSCDDMAADKEAK